MMTMKLEKLQELGRNKTQLSHLIVVVMMMHLMMEVAHMTYTTSSAMKDSGGDGMSLAEGNPN